MVTNTIVTTAFVLTTKVVIWYLIPTVKCKVNNMTGDSERRSLKEFITISDRTVAHIEMSSSVYHLA